MNPEIHPTIPTLPLEQVSRTFTPDKVGMRVIDCFVIEHERRSYYSEVSWSDGEGAASAKLVRGDRSLPGTPVEAEAVELNFQYNPSKTPKPGQAFGSERYMMSAKSWADSQGLVRSFAQSMMNGVDFQGALSEIRDVCARFGYKISKVESNVMVVNRE